MVRVFSDDFLFSSKPVDGSEMDSSLFCSASSDERKEFGGLSDMAGSGAKRDDQAAPSHDTSFDLESELSQALNTGSSNDYDFMSSQAAIITEPEVESDAQPEAVVETAMPAEREDVSRSIFTAPIVEEAVQAEPEQKVEAFSLDAESLQAAFEEEAQAADDVAETVVAQDVEPAVASEAAIENEIAMPVEATATPEPTMEFGDLISAEFDKALAAEEQLAAELAQEVEAEFAIEAPAIEAPIEPDLAPTHDYAPEVAAHAEPVKSFSDPLEELGLVLPSVAAEPPVQAPPMQAALPQTPVFQAPVPEMAEEASRDYSDPAAAFQNFPGFEPQYATSAPEVASSPAIETAPIPSAMPHATQLNIAEPAVEAEANPLTPIDAVLGASAALGAVASASAVRSDPVEPHPPFMLDETLDAPVGEQMTMAAPEPIITNGGIDEMDVAFDADNGGFDDDVAIPPHHIPVETRGGANGRRVAFGVLAVALMGGIGALAWNSLNAAPTGEAPTILADAAPVKVKPKDSGGKVVPNQDRTVYEKVGGAETTVPAQKTLKNGAEEPIKIAKVQPKANVRISTSEGDAKAIIPAKTGANNNLVLRPRAVRTVVVKPDGTIVTTEAPAAPKVAETSNQPDTSTTGGVKFSPPSAETKEVLTKPEQVAKLEPVKPVAAKPIKVTPIKIAPKPAPKPVAKKPVKKPAPVKVAAKKPAPKPKKVALPKVSSPYAVQISSRRSPEAAKSAWTKLARRYRGVLAQYSPDIREKTISGRGKFYQVRVPANSKAAASAICSRLKRAGGDCFVTR